MFYEWISSFSPIAYPEALQRMSCRVEEILEGKASDLVWCLEHPSLYTAGTSAKPHDLLEPDKFPVYETGRGGQYTYHGPGQRVAYVMMDLNKQGKDIRQFVYRLEEWIIQTLSAFKIIGERRVGRVGIWVTSKGTDKKIAAIGVRLKRWVSYHGAAININPTLEHFSGIVPCGLRDFGVTSLEELGIKTCSEEIDDLLQKNLPILYQNSLGYRDLSVKARNG